MPSIRKQIMKIRCVPYNWTTTDRIVALGILKTISLKELRICLAYRFRDILLHFTTVGLILKNIFA